MGTVQDTESSHFDEVSGKFHDGETIFRTIFHGNQVKDLISPHLVVVSRD